MKLILALCLVISATMGVSIQRFVLDYCPRHLWFSDGVSLYQGGEVWQERCRTCRCADGQVTCTLNEGVVCDKPYDPSYDLFCLKWSDDKCCCEEVGCTKNGKNYKFGEYYKEDPANPCSPLCECLPFARECSVNKDCSS